MRGQLDENSSWPSSAINGYDKSSVTATLPKAIRNICCLGAGYVGGPTCAVIANKCLEIDVTVADLNPERIKAWHTNHLPIYEPGLLEILQPARDGIPNVRKPNLYFSTDIRGAIAKAELILLCVPTPTKSTGTGAGQAADMVYVEAAARMVAEVAEDDKIVVEKSTVPCKTADDLRKIFAAIGRPGVHFDILSNPEFLAEGTAIKDLLEPDRVLIGSLKDGRGLQAAAALAEVYGRWVPHERIITMNLWSSEMAKLSANALLAQRISSINALSAVCEATGADVDEVSYACGLDSRIGSRMLKSSVGFGGSCFKKDVLSLVYIAESHNLPEVATYWKGIVDINEYQKDRFIKRIVKCLFSTLTNKKVAILGYAYKKDTGDTRESAAISIVNHLIRENAEVSIYDPKVEEAQVWQSLKESNDRKALELIKSRVTVCQTPYEACEGADAVVIATEWDEFSNRTSHDTPISSKPPPERTGSFRIPPRKRIGGLVIRDPNTGSVVTFDNKPAAATSAALPPISEKLDPGNSSGDGSSRSSIVNANRDPSTPNTSFSSPLTEMSHDPNRGFSVTEYSDEAETATSRQLNNYALTTIGSYWLGKTNRNNTSRQAGPGSTTTDRINPASPEFVPSGISGNIGKPTDQDETTKKMNWSHVARVMRRPMFVFDGRNVVDAEKLGRLGFWVEGIGKPGMGGQ